MFILFIKANLLHEQSNSLMLDNLLFSGVFAPKNLFQLFSVTDIHFIYNAKYSCQRS